MNAQEGPWDALGLVPTCDAREIRRAYARKLKQIQPEDDPDGFQALRNAYEWALHLAAMEAPAQGNGQAMAQEPAPTVESAPPTVQDRPAPDQPSPQVDTDAQALEQALQSLAALLQDSGPLDEEQALRLLHAATSSEMLVRLDLLHRAEQALGYILATSIPRSDALLPAADRAFEWGSRRDERDLPEAVRAVLARIDDLALLHTLRTGRDAQSKAFERLARPARPLLRATLALLHVSTWPELELLAKLEWRHPRLLADLPAENVDWWVKFSRRPHLSWLSFAIGGGIAWFMHLAYADASQAAMLLWLIPLAGLSAALLRLYVVDWPALKVQRRWAGRAPPWLELGWLPAGIALMSLAVSAAGIAWLAWACAALAMLVALWAAIVAGPTPSIFTERQILVMNSRLVRAFILNVFALVWIGVMTSEEEWIFTGPFLVTLAAGLMASSFGRELQIRAQRERIAVRTQMALCGLLIVAAVVACYLLIILRVDSRWHAALVVGVLALLMLRRSMPFELPGFDVPRFAGFGVIILVNIARAAIGDLFDFRMADGSQSGGLVLGGSVMLAGVVISAGAWIFRLARQR